MRIYEKDYEKIRGIFVMKDRDEHSFDPGAPDFVENALSYALRKSFADFNFRTLTAIKSDPKIDFVCGFDQWKKERKKQGKPATTTERTDYLMEKLENANFYRQFVEYFKPNSLHKNDFEKWHHDTCTLFLNTLQNDYQNLCYGKAQKIVNMMFKHLYCLDGAATYDDYFTPCHLVLDRFTLEWLRRNLPSVSKVGVWSNLQYDTAKNEWENYAYYVKEVSDYFKRPEIQVKYNCLTPFQFEFYMWNEMKLHLAAEEFYFAMLDDPTDKKRQEFREKDIDEKIAEVDQAIRQYQAR